MPPARQPVRGEAITGVSDPEEARALRLKRLCLKLEEGPIAVWPYAHAPEELRERSARPESGDWLVYLPSRYADTYVGWLAATDASGLPVCRLLPAELGGGMVVVGGH